jgi:hypothetical protein
LIEELAAAPDREEIIIQEPLQSACTVPLGDAFADLFGFVQTMSEEFSLLRAKVVTLKAKELSSNDVIDGLRSFILDLEEMSLCKKAVDDPVPERVSKSASDREKMSSKKKKTHTFQKGNVLSRQKSRKLPAASD